jgi:methionyl-tRNA formyltransferase
MKLVFFGSGAFGLPTLAALATRHNVAAVVTQPDKPAGRGSSLTPTPIAAWAAESGLALHKPERVNTPEMVELIRGIGADAWVVIAFGQKLSTRLLDGVFAINLHASLLPRWRGAAPINAAILGGDSVTGNSVITLADKMDAGLVLGQSRRDITPQVTAGELHDQLSQDGPELVLRVLEQFAAGAMTPVTQDESLVTLAGKFSKADGVIDWSVPAERCRHRVHGLTPWPGVTVQFRGQPLKILRASVETPGQDGEVGAICDGAAGIVQCGDGTRLRLLEVQPAGGRAMMWKDFAAGRKPLRGESMAAPLAPAKGASA